MPRPPPSSPLFPSAPLGGGGGGGGGPRRARAGCGARDQALAGGVLERAGGAAAHRRLPLRRGRRSEEHTSELQSRLHLVCRLLLEKKKKMEKQRVRHVIDML